MVSHKIHTNLFYFNNCVTDSRDRFLDDLSNSVKSIHRKGLAQKKVEKWDTYQFLFCLSELVTGISKNHYGL